jgi:glycosyltransferase involved in cell wall biosynthesis
MGFTLAQASPVRISVVMPAHNVAPYVGEALASIHAQEGIAFELIAVDDGSTDATPAILAEWAERFAASGRAMTIVTRQQGGAGAARNDALDRARGDLLCFVDADDRLHPEALVALAERLDNDPTLDFVFPLCRHIDQHGRPLGIVSRVDRRLYSAPDLLFANPIHSGTGVMVRRASAEAAGRFDTSLPACIDLDYWVRVTAYRRENIAVLPRVLVDYRMRPGQITGDWRRMRRGWEAMAARAERLGLGFTRRARSAALARNALVWSTAAYKHGEMASARQLALEFWWHDARFALSDAHARVRTAACLASLLPRPVHSWIRARYNHAR